MEVTVGSVRHPVSIQLELAGQVQFGIFGHVHQQNLARQKRRGMLKALLRLNCHGYKVDEIQLF